MEKELADFVEKRIAATVMGNGTVRMEQLLQLHDHLPRGYGIMRPVAFGDYPHQEQQMPLIHCCEFYYTTGVHDELEAHIWYSDEYRDGFHRVMRIWLPQWIRNGRSTLGALMPYMNMELEMMQPRPFIEMFQNGLDEYTRMYGNDAVAMQVVAKHWQNKYTEDELESFRDSSRNPPSLIWSVKAGLDTLAKAAQAPPKETQNE